MTTWKRGDPVPGGSKPTDPPIFALAERTAVVELPVRPCAKRGVHGWHMCKPGGSQAWICPGLGDWALSAEDRVPAPFGMIGYEVARLHC